MEFEVFEHVINMFRPWKIGPLNKKSKNVQCKFHAFFKFCSTCTNHNFLNFCPMKVILDFLETSRCPLQLSC